MDYEAKVKLTSAGAAGAVLTSASDEPTLHHFDLWYTSNVVTMGTGKYNASSKITTWTIYLSQQASESVKLFSVNAEFTFAWAQSLRLVDRATPIGNSHA